MSWEAVTETPSSGWTAVDETSADQKPKATVSAEPKEAPGYIDQAIHGVGDVLSGLWKTATASGERAKEIGDHISKGEYGPAALKILQSSLGLGYDAIVAPAIDQAAKAKTYAEHGRYSEAVGHLGAAALPIFGPMAASFADTGTGEPIERPGEQVEEPHEGEPVRAMAQAATAYALGKAGEVDPGSVVAGVKGAAKGAYEGLTSTSEIPAHGYAGRALKAIGVDKIPTVPLAAVAGKYAAHAIIGPEASIVGEVMGGAAPIIHGAIKGAKEALSDYADSKAVAQPPHVPVWANLPESTEQSPVAVGPTEEPNLPSGRKTGPAPPPPPVEKAVRIPAWANLPEAAAADEPIAPEVTAPQLPSGRKVGSIANQIDTPASEPPAPEETPEPVAAPKSKAAASKSPATDLKEGELPSLDTFKESIAANFAKKPYAKITNAAERATVDSIAQKLYDRQVAQKLYNEQSASQPSNRIQPQAIEPTSQPEETSSTGQEKGVPLPKVMQDGNYTLSPSNLPLREGHVPVESQDIHSLKHDPTTNELEVHFRADPGGQGSLYKYQNVPTETYERIRDAVSSDSAFRTMVKANPKDMPYQRQYLPGNIVRLKPKGPQFRITKVNPDNTFEYEPVK